MSIFGWKVAVLYVVLGLVIAVVGGTLIEKLHLENYVEGFIRNANTLDVPQEELHFKDRIKYAWEQVLATAKKVAPYVLIGVGIGAFIHNWIPEDFIVKVLGTGNPFGVSLAEYGLPAIIDYGSDSCIPCKEMAPALKLLNEEMYGKAFVKFADVWVYSDAASNVPVQVIPTQVLVNADGTPFVPSDELAAKIQFTMYSDKNTNEHVFTVHQGGLTEEQMREILNEMGVE